MFFSTLDFFDSYSLFENNEKCDLDVYSFITSVFDNKKSGVVFGSTGAGKTTLLNSLIKESNDFGIVKNVYISDFFEFQPYSKNTNLVLQSKNFPSVSEFSKILSYFKIERVFVEEVSSPFDVELIAAILKVGIPVIFTTHANDLSNLIEIITSFSSEEDAKYIFSNINFALQPVRFLGGGRYKHLFFHDFSLNA